jgi:probable phosphoglycerate mutase
MTVYLLRHGHIDPGPEKRYIGWTDLALSLKGAEQARFWRDWFAGRNLNRVVTSDLARALATARIVAECRSVPVETDPAFREVSLGAWEGLTFAHVKARWPEAFDLRGADPAGRRPPEGESFSDLWARVGSAFSRHVTAGPGDLLIVTHLGPLRVLLCGLLGVPLENLFLLQPDYGTLAVLEPLGDRFRLTGLIPVGGLTGINPAG